LPWGRKVESSPKTIVWISIVTVKETNTVNARNFVDGTLLLTINVVFNKTEFWNEKISTAIDKNTIYVGNCNALEL
jgi:hypothetical protein